VIDSNCEAGDSSISVLKENGNSDATEVLPKLSRPPSLPLIGEGDSSDSGQLPRAKIEYTMPK
jgi:hypothetical protein